MKAVDGDVAALIDAGVIERSGAHVAFAHGAIHVDFMTTSARNPVRAA